MLQKRFLLLFTFFFFFESCGLVGNVFRKVTRVLFPKDCTVEVKLDTDGIKYMDDLWDYSFRLSHRTPASDFVSSVKFTPEAKYYRDLTGYNWSEDRFSLSQWNLLPGVAYKVEVSKFYSEEDCRHSAAVHFEIPSLSYKPRFSIHSENTFESELDKVLPLSVASIEEFKVRYAEVSPQILIQAVGAAGEKYNRHTSGISWKTKTWKPGEKINANQDQGMNLDSYFGSAGKKSWIALELGANVIDEEGKEKFKTENIFLQSTNLGISAKADQEKVYVWVNTLSKAIPVEKVKIGFYESGIQKGSCETDVNGYCSLSASNIVQGKSLIIAEQGETDKAFLYLGATKLYHYNYYADGNSLHAKLYFDRKLYRPGDRVEIKTFAGEKRNGSFFPYGGRSLTFKLKDSRGKDILSQTAVTSSQGGAHLSYTIPKDAPLGHYGVSVYPTEKIENYISYDSFQVEEFRPVNFAVSVELKQKVLMNEPVKGKIEGRYLFGAPMANANAKYSLLKKTKGIYFPDFSQYHFGGYSYYNDYEDDYSEDSSGYITGEEAVLNEKGELAFELPLKSLATEFSTSGSSISINSPYRLLLEASVLDVDGKSVTKTEAVDYYPSDSLVGIKCDDRYQGMEKNFKFELVTVSPEGKPLSGKNLKAYIIYNDWTSVLSKGIGKYFFRSNQLEKKIVDTKNLTTAGGKARFDYKVKDSGSYTLIVTNEDSVYSRIDFYAYQKETYYTWDFRGDDSIELKSDKQIYSIGDKAKVIIKSPFTNARAIVTVERDNVYFSESYQMKGNSLPIEIPIEAKYLPNVEVSVLLLTGRQSLPKDASEEDKKEFNEQDLGAPRSKTGYITLKVDTSGKIAPLEVKTDRNEYSPRDKVKIFIKTTPRSELVVSVADRGVLDLVGYQFTDPISVFYKLWRNIVDTFDLRELIIKHYAYQNKGDSPGGDYGEEAGGGFGFDSESGIRKDFRHTAYWNPSVIADSDGEAELEFTLPDNLTTFRVMVASSNNGTYAAKNKEFRVKKSLVLQKTASRFVRIGDELELGVSVTNNTEKNGKFKVDISSSLLSSQKPEILELNAGQTKQVVRKFKLTKEDYLKISGKSSPDSELVATYDVKAEPVSYSDYPDLKKADISDLLRVTIPIKELDPVVTERITGFTDSSYKQQIRFPSIDSVLAGKMSLNVNLSATALTGIRNAFDFYQSQPYFCMEQRTSAYLVTISAGELLKEFKYFPPTKDSYDFNQIEKLFLDEMSEFQYSDGSFSLWKQKWGRSGYPYLTAYVAQAMQLGKEKGFRSNETAMKEAVKYLENYVKNPYESKQESWQTLSLIYSVLAKEKKDVTGLQKSLFDNFSSLNPKSQSIFLLAYAEKNNINQVSSDSIFKKHYDLFLKNIIWEKDSVRVVSQKENYWDSYYSQATVLSGLLKLMIRVESENKKIPELIRNIMIERSTEYWRDSHSSGNLAFALREYRNRYEVGGSDTEGEVYFGEKNLISESFSGSSSNLLQEEFFIDRLFDKKQPTPTDLSFQRKSTEGRLYFSSNIRYTPVKDDRKASSNGINVEKKIYRVDGRNANGDPILKETGDQMQRGKTYLVKIAVNSDEDRPFLMVVDPIPSTVEVVNTSFLTESRRSGENTHSDSYEGEEYEDEGGSVFQMSYGEFEEFRDDRVLFSRDRIHKGKTEFQYFLRPLVKGVALSPAAEVFLMYHPSIKANTSTTKLKVD
ncbi:alpha-2-macroglobulin family protein [Leptospira idonii]|uniref:Peptidase n=1 Tax=Leptospira idonii TaxID=1193500 RepID=A0A4R9LU31_9LEPT|nr:MG2 domain-containing protein [Leptospira idonii]TGN17276.1 peptidase [Leptospira idonii]